MVVNGAHCRSRNRKRSVSDILVGNPGGDAAFADYLILVEYSDPF